MWNNSIYIYEERSNTTNFSLKIAITEILNFEYQICVMRAISYKNAVVQRKSMVVGLVFVVMFLIDCILMY